MRTSHPITIVVEADDVGNNKGLRETGEISGATDLSSVGSVDTLSHRGLVGPFAESCPPDFLH